MNRHWKTIAVLFAVAALLSLTLIAGAAPMSQETAAPAAAEGASVLTMTKTVSPREQAAALTFWSAERLAAAQPQAMPVDNGGAEVDLAAIQSRAAAPGPAGYAAPGAPAANADRLARAAYPEAWTSTRAKSPADSLPAMPAQDEGTSQLYTSYVVNSNASVWKSLGNRAIGRLSFSTLSGTSYCSATVISPNNVIVTAAHCVYDTTNNRWYNNWVFTPAYRDGAAPFGTFPADKCTILTSWANLSGNYSINTWAPYDVAVCNMKNNSFGQGLSSLTGYQGRMWNWGYVRNIHNLGYPFNDYRNIVLNSAGKYMRLCTNETFQQATDVMGGGCNWGPGISGGPWIANYNPFNYGFVNNVNSGLFIGTQNLYAGRFTSNNIVPLCTAAGC